ncbi:uncharacterized protein LOC144649210 isoform X2 [Oculina patagonica]
MESKNEDSDDIEYERAFAALDELKLARLKPFFKEHFLQDATLFYMKSEEELKNVLIKELKLPFGQGFIFSRFWFNKYHKRAETLDAPGLETPPRQENVQSEEVITLKNAHKEEDGRSDSPFDLTPTKSKNADSTQAEKLPMSDQVVETISIRSDTEKFAMQQQEKQAETVVHSVVEETSKSVPFDATLSVPLPSPGECLEKEDLGENKQDSAELQNQRIDEKCQSETEEMLSTPTLKTADSAFTIEIKNDEPKQAYFTGTLGPEKPKEVCKKGRTFEVIQETVTVQRDEMDTDDSRISDSKELAIKAKEPENDQEDTSPPLATTVDNNAMTTNNERSPSNDDLDMHILQTDSAAPAGNSHTAANVCQEEGTDHNVTAFFLGKNVLDDQAAAESEACRTEKRTEHLCTDSKPYQSDHEAQDSNGSSIREFAEEKESPLAVNEGVVQVTTVAALCEDLHENETSKSEKPGKALKTTINQSNVLDHEVQSSSDETANESQENTTKGNAVNGKVVSTETVVDDQPEDKTCIAEQTGSFIEQTELPALLADSVGSNKEDNPRRSNAKKGGKKSRNKSKLVGIVESHEQSEKEKTSLEEKSLASNDSDEYPKGGEKELDFKQENIAGEFLRGDTTLIDENSNILDIEPTAMKTAASDVAISDTAEPLASKEESSGSEKTLTETVLPSHDAKESRRTSFEQQIPTTSSNQGIEREGKNTLLEKESYQEVTESVFKCNPRPFGVKGKDISYQKGFVLDAEENREVEFKSLTSAQPLTLPWKIMDKAKKFICGCLNADSKGIIYFGVGDCQEQCSKFKRGEVLGLYVEDVIDDIVKAFQFVLDDHIKSDDGTLQKGGDQNCVNLEFIPVTSEGSPTKLYVVEIEITRDWKLCKDNVYYSKRWTEKRGVNIDKDSSIKKALSDFYKVHKDEFDDVAVRTNGASSSVKQHEVNRQVKEPLTAKYKEWKREAKLGISEAAEGPIPDDSDTKRFSTLVRDRLRDMNFKDFGYILIANKLPPQHRGTPHLAFLQNIPWLAVFDLFDAASKKDGLHYVCNETTDAPRAKLRSLDDFKEVSSDWISGKDFTLPTRGTTWILSNEEMQKGDWIKCSRDCFYRALSAYKLCFPPGRLLCVFLGLGENAVQEMVDMMECCFSIFGNLASSCITILSESKNVAESLIKASKSSLQKELKECSVTGIPWRLLKEIVREMVGPTKFEERGATTELPFFTGQLKEVLNKVIHSWDDLEVYSPNPRLPSLAEDIEKARNAFYKGAQASQTNLFHNHCIPRTLEEETSLKVEHALKSLYMSKPAKDLGCHVKTVTVPYEPGSGATTMCRRILWNKRKAYRCAVVKAITPATDYQIDQLQGIIYDEKNISFSPPALVLVDNFPENETRRLTAEIMKRQTKCVILSTFPIGKLSTNSDFDITTLRQLDEKELSLVKNILINITSDSERRRGAEEVLEREKRFIWFGLELFGRDYDKIEKRLQNHINSTLNFLGDSQEIHEMVLNFCCFLHYYSDGRAILPHPVASDFLYEASNETEEACALMQHIHKIFGGLLLEGFNETNGYYGWRPAHSLVSEVVTSRISIENTAILLLEKVHKGKAYVNKFLKEQVFKLFLDRKRISDPVFLANLATDDGTIDSDFESEVVGFYEVRTRYSPLIVDILEGDNGIRGALRLLITICEKASQTEENAYAWQQLARFMGYEMRANEMDSTDEMHHRLHTTMIKEGDLKLPMPETGIEAAHVAVDIAINEQPKYSHHYVTKGVLYLLQLRDFKPEELPNLSCSLPAVIDICRKALDVYDKALSTTHALNHYSMIGKIQAIVSLLKIVKGLPFFRPEGESFTRYLKTSEIPREMEDALTQEEHSYLQGLSTTTLNLFNELFRDVKLRQMTTYDENATRGLNNAKIRASKLRRTFYEVTGFDRSELSDVEVPMLSSPLPRDAPALYQQIVQDILFKHDETPYSSWANLSDGDVSSIYNLLRALCLRGYGSHDDLLICCKACLRLNERPAVDELDKIVSKWVAKYPNSEWAHLFNYMIHFPIPNGSLAAFSHSAKVSIKKCDKIVREKTGIGFRKSGAEYFLGKGIGLYAIANSQEFRWLETKRESKTDFWRSKEISEKLERVCGQKDVNFKGVITYQGIQLRFDDTRYPKESKDDLWFYIGFSVAGPYAYDPVDNDTYDIMKRKISESVSPDFPSFDAANPKDTYDTNVSRKGIIQSKVGGRYSITQRSQGLNAAKVENLGVLSEDFPGFDCSTPQLQVEKPTSSSMPQFLNTEPSGCPDGPTMVSNSILSSSSKMFPSMSSWVSADNLHHPTTSSKQVSYAFVLQIESERREKEITNAAKMQQPGEACKDTYDAFVSRRRKMGELKYSITKRSQSPDEAKPENQDVLSDDVLGIPYSTPPLQAEKPISSSMPHFLNVLPSGCPENSAKVPNSTLSSSPRGFSSMSSWVSADNLHHPATSSRRVSYATALQNGSARLEEQTTKATSMQQPAGAGSLSLAKDRHWKSIQGTRGNQKKAFQPRYVDKTGKLHHGSWVLGAEKSKECKIHTSLGSDITSTSRCPFAHSWRGDTLQHVCIKCTRSNKPVCKERRNHETFIWNLGPYYKEDGTIWKDPQQ